MEALTTALGTINITLWWLHGLNVPMGTLLRADHGEYRRPFIPDPLLAQRLLQLPRCSSPAKDIVRGAFLDRKGGSRVWTALWLRGGRCAILFPEPDRSSLRRFTGIKWWSPRTAALYGLSVSFVSQIFLLEQIKDPRGALEAVLTYCTRADTVGVLFAPGPSKDRGSRMPLALYSR